MKHIWRYIREREWLAHLIVAAGFLCFLGVAVFGEQGLYQLHKAFKLKTKFTGDIADFEKKIEELKKQKELLNNDPHLEIIIRQELGYVKPGETVFQQIE